MCCFFNYPATTEIYTYLHTLSLHDALPIYRGIAVVLLAVGVGELHRFHQQVAVVRGAEADRPQVELPHERSEEHTSELQSLMRISYAVFCLKKKKTIPTSTAKHTNYQKYINTNIPKTTKLRCPT